ncbi:hypothetical protein AHF37_03135 [Paragonimus kellicotti]|nr:hypothetical protein AHF37_03135 [Paragonimus kellicotti]
MVATKSYGRAPLTCINYRLTSNPRLNKCEFIKVELEDCVRTTQHNDHLSRINPEDAYPLIPMVNEFMSLTTINPPGSVPVRFCGIYGSHGSSVGHLLRERAATHHPPTDFFSRILAPSPVLDNALLFIQPQVAHLLPPANESQQADTGLPPTEEYPFLTSDDLNEVETAEQVVFNSAKVQMVGCP